jgi:hypothetical protein
MEADRTETKDIAGEHPQIRDELVDLYDAWADRANVRPWPVERQAG